MARNKISVSFWLEGYNNGDTSSDRFKERLPDLIKSVYATEYNIKLNGLNLSFKEKDSVDYLTVNGVLTESVFGVSSNASSENFSDIVDNILVDHVQSDLKGLDSLIAPSSGVSNVNIDVSNSSNYGLSTYAWGSVRNLTNSISTSESSYWGAKNSTN